MGTHQNDVGYGGTNKTKEEQWHDKQKQNFVNRVKEDNGHTFNFRKRRSEGYEPSGVYVVNSVFYLI